MTRTRSSSPGENARLSQAAEAPTTKEALKAQVEQRAVLQRLMLLGRNAAPQRAEMIKKSLALYYKQVPSFYQKAQGDFAQVAAEMRARLSTIPEDLPGLKSFVEEILPNLTHAVPSEDNMPSDAKYLVDMGNGHFRVNLTMLNRDRTDLQSWLENGYVGKHPEITETLLLVLGGLNAYAQILDPVSAGFSGITLELAKNGDPTGILKTPPQGNPYIRDLARREGMALRLMGMAVLGGMGLLTGIMSLKSKDAKLPVFYLGLAALFGVGPEALGGYSNKTELRELASIGVGEPGGTYERLVGAYGTSGREWATIAKRLKDMDLREEEWQPMIDKMNRGKALTTDDDLRAEGKNPTAEKSEEAKMLDQMAPNAPEFVRAQARALLRNARHTQGDGHDFLTLVGLIQAPRSEGVQECLYRCIESDIGPEKLQMIKEDMQSPK